MSDPFDKRLDKKFRQANLAAANDKLDKLDELEGVLKGQGEEEEKVIENDIINLGLKAKKIDNIDKRNIVLNNIKKAYKLLKKAKSLGEIALQRHHHDDYFGEIEAARRSDDILVRVKDLVRNAKENF